MDSAPVPADSRRNERISVVFVGGFGRSGSTLLARLLAEVPGFVTVGEIAQIWERGFAQNVRCGCGQPFRHCPFWISTVKQAFGSEDLPAFELDRLRKFWRHRSWPLFAVPSLSRPRYHAAFAAYAMHTGQLLRAVQRVSGCRYIVDTSKTPMHLAALTAIPNVDVHVVHLVRDSRAVAFSWQRERPRTPQRTDVAWPPAHPLKTALLWSGTNALLWFLRKRGRSYTLVRYEDLVAEPANCLGGLLAVMGAGAATPPRATGGVVEFGVHHTVAGNPMRFERGAIEVREDAEWKERMPRVTRWAVTALTRPLSRLYGY